MKVTFPAVFKVAVDQVTRDTVINVFKKAGLYPFDASVVDYTKCVKDQLRKAL